MVVRWLLWGWLLWGLSGSCCGGWWLSGGCCGGCPVVVVGVARWLLWGGCCGGCLAAVVGVVWWLLHVGGVLGSTPGLPFHFSIFAS